MATLYASSWVPGEILSICMIIKPCNIVLISKPFNSCWKFDFSIAICWTNHSWNWINDFPSSSTTDAPSGFFFFLGGGGDKIGYLQNKTQWKHQLIWSWFGDHIKVVFLRVNTNSIRLSFLIIFPMINICKSSQFIRKP